MKSKAEDSVKLVQTDTPKNQNTTSNILAWYVNGQFDEFLMIMMLEMLVKLSNLIPPAIESYIIRQIRPFTDQKFSTNIKKQLKGRKEHMSTKVFGPISRRKCDLKVKMKKKSRF